VREEPTALLIAALGGVFVACFKLGRRKGQLVNLEPLRKGEALAWSAIAAR
jgi:hypothetical protein